MRRRSPPPAGATPGPFERSPAQIGTALVAVLLIAGNVALGLAPDPSVPALVVHVSGTPQPGWYGGSTAGEVLADGNASVAFLAGHVTDGDSLAVFGGYARPVDAAAPVAWSATGQKVHLNAASLAELEALPRIGPALASRILAARPFRTIDDLDRVKGIGPATLRALRPFAEP